jgi:hypothetical protein
MAFSGASGLPAGPELEAATTIRILPLGRHQGGPIMRLRIAGASALVAILLVGLVPSVAASNASCTAQFASTTAKVARPFGQNIVVPEVRNLTLGGRNVGQEVKVLLATADKSACPLG